jgi:hypothetical protein
LDSSAGGYGAVAMVAFKFTKSAKKIGAQRARQPKYDWYISTYFLRSERQPSNKRSNEKMARSFGGNGKETMVKFHALWLFSCQIFSTICSR